MSVLQIVYLQQMHVVALRLQVHEEEALYTWYDIGGGSGGDSGGDGGGSGGCCTADSIWCDAM
jgi:hypothetical protein